MKQTIGLEKIELFPREAVASIATKHLTKLIDRIFNKGKDAHGKSMKKYSPQYAKWKAKKGRNISPVDLTFTANTRLNTHVKKDKTGRDSYVLGWDNEPAAIIEYQKQRKPKYRRDVYTTIPQDELDWVRDQFHKNIDKQMRVKIKSHIRIVAGR